MNEFVILTLALAIFINCVEVFAEVDFSNPPVQQEAKELVFVNILFRHGDRTPVEPYPNDPYKNASYWPVGFGQLTNIGKEHEYELGEWLRERYDALLTEEYSPDIVHVQSTDKDRTLMSASLVLAGVFPPTEKQRWNPRVKWQPIPVHTVPEDLDKVLAAKVHCPAYKEEIGKVLKSEEIQEIKNKYSEVFKVVNENCGKDITDFEQLEYVYDTLFIEDLNNFTLPEWTKNIYPQPLKEASKYSFALPTWTLKLGRLKSGLLVQDMIGHMKFKVENKHKSHPKVWMYSAHDSTVANLLNTLGVFDMQCPPYSSVVMMELWKDSNDQHQVKLLFRNSSSHEPYLLKLPGCSSLCPLDQFTALCEAFIPKDWDSECQVSSKLEASQPLPYSEFTIAALVISSLLILVLVVSVVLYRQKRKQPTHWYQKLRTDNL